jgi:hypothetical protein
MLQQQLSDWSCASLSRCTLGDIALRNDDHAAAAALFIDAIVLQRDHGIPILYRVADSFWGLAAAAAGQRRWVRAARLLGAAEAARGDAPIRLATRQRPAIVARHVERHMDQAVFAAALADGAAMSREEALECALADREAVSPHARLRSPSQ